MNLRLDNVVSDVTGQTGMRILKALIAGERDVKKLGQMRDPHCKASAEVIAQSLVGNYRQEHLFSLKQAVELFEFYQQKIRECEEQIEGYLKKLPLDPWNKPYLYASPGQHGEADVWTLGADGKEGGEGGDADIGSWQ